MYRNDGPTTTVNDVPHYNLEFGIEEEHVYKYAQIEHLLLGRYGKLVSTASSASGVSSAVKAARKKRIGKLQQAETQLGSQSRVESLRRIQWQKATNAYLERIEVLLQNAELVLKEAETPPQQVRIRRCKGVRVFNQNCAREAWLREQAASQQAVPESSPSTEVLDEVLAPPDLKQRIVPVPVLPRKVKLGASFAISKHRLSTRRDRRTINRLALRKTSVPDRNAWRSVRLTSKPKQSTEDTLQNRERSRTSSSQLARRRLSIRKTRSLRMRYFQSTFTIGDRNRLARRIRSLRTSRQREPLEDLKGSDRMLEARGRYDTGQAKESLWDMMRSCEIGRPSADRLSGFLEVDQREAERVIDTVQGLLRADVNSEMDASSEADYSLGVDTSPEVDARPELDARPKLDEKSELNARPELEAQPEMDVSSAMDASSEVAVKLEVDTKPELAVKPEQGADASEAPSVRKDGAYKPF